jgi:DNA modification methylase
VSANRRDAHASKHISIINVEELIPYKQNAKLHSPKQVRQIANSINQFGFINPIIINDKKEVIAGHGRLEAAKLLNNTRVPVICVDHLSETEVRAYRLADNQLTMNTGYDDDLLKVELSDLSSLDLDFDLEITGFETAEIDLILTTKSLKENNPDDSIPEPEDGPAVVLPGDVFIMGKHRLICGDSTIDATFSKLMLEDKASAITTDPPYNVKVNGHVCGLGKQKHREFAMASGEMSSDEFIDFLSQFMKHCIRFSVNGSLHYIFMDWRHIYALLHAGYEEYTELHNICVWNKNNGGMGAMYRSKHELVAVFKSGTKPHINNIELGKYGRYRTNVWDYSGVNSFGQNQQDIQMHPTVKPVAMLIDAIKDCTRRDHIVLDPFGGSGSTLIACEKSDRVARLIELDPLYCDTIIRRWQELTGKDAILESTHMSFNDIAVSNAGGN